MVLETKKVLGMLIEKSLALIVKFPSTFFTYRSIRWLQVNKNVYTHPGVYVFI